MTRAKPALKLAGLLILLLMAGIFGPRNVASITYLRTSLGSPERAIWDHDCLLLAAALDEEPRLAIDAPVSLLFSSGRQPDGSAFSRCIQGAELWILGDRAGARAAWTGLSRLGVILAERASRTVENREALLDDALAIDSDDPRVWEFACQIRGNATDDQALNACREAVRRNPGSRASREQLALVLQRRGALQEAVDVLNSGNLFDGTITWTIRGDLALERADAPSAILYYTQAAPGWPTNQYLAFNLGRAYEMKNDRANAETWYQRSLSIDPGFTPAREALRRLD